MDVCNCICRTKHTFCEKHRISHIVLEKMKIEHKTSDISENLCQKRYVQMHRKKESTDFIFTKHRNMV